MARKAIVEMIFVLLIMVAIFIIGYSILVNFVAATPAQNALKNLQEVVDDVCIQTGNYYQEITIFLPEGNKILLKRVGGLMELYDSSDTKIDTKKLTCPKNTLFAECTIGRITSGKESITIGVKKTLDIATGISTITLNDSASLGLISCI